MAKKDINRRVGDLARYGKLRCMMVFEMLAQTEVAVENGGVDGLGKLAVCIPVLMGVMQLIRRTPAMEKCKDYFSWIGILLGLGAAFLWLDPATPTKEKIIMGFMAGLAVSGLYDATKKLPGGKAVMKIGNGAAVILLCFVLAVGAGGCNGVNLNGQYENMLAQNVAWSAGIALRAMAQSPAEGCYVGALTCEQAARALQYSSDHWQLFWEASQ